MITCKATVSIFQGEECCFWQITGPDCTLTFDTLVDAVRELRIVTDLGMMEAKAVADDARRRARNDRDRIIRLNAMRLENAQRGA